MKSSYGMSDEFFRFARTTMSVTFSKMTPVVFVSVTEVKWL